ncbi:MULTISPECIES: hypothetical protein [unclassified Acinetobacter]|uniref:hypothetical protein n=1 Tax=unclassified Acinetobacter TaxID=196816 RepID=UPI0035B95657
MKKVLLATLCASAVSIAHAGFFDDLNKAVTAVNSVIGAINTASSGAIVTPNTSQTSTTFTGTTMATPTDYQLQKIAQSIVVSSIQDPKLRQAVTQALDNINKMLLITSCQTTSDDLYLGEVLSPKANMMFIKNPNSLNRYKNHPKDKCLTVQNIGDWKLENDELRFNVVYSSDITGATANIDVYMTQDNGQWLVTMLYNFNP